jgi:type IV pilus assembly protein PilE
VTHGAPPRPGRARSRPLAPQRRRPAGRGFTLVEMLLVLALTGLAAALALPAWQTYLLRAARADGAAALAIVQARQERHFDNIGWYASSLAALGGATASPQGRYRIELVPRDADGYIARAHAVGAQQSDLECPTLTLDVRQGLARTGPSARCWGR